MFELAARLTFGAFFSENNGQLSAGGGGGGWYSNIIIYTQLRSPFGGSKFRIAFFFFFGGGGQKNNLYVLGYDEIMHNFFGLFGESFLNILGLFLRSRYSIGKCVWGF